MNNKNRVAAFRWTTQNDSMTTSSKDYQRMAAAIRYLVEQRIEMPGLERVAAEVGLSPHHLQRLFRRWVGISPKRFQQFLKANEALQLLQSSLPVLDAAFELGLSSGGRLHDLTLNMFAATPGEVARSGAGVTVRYGPCATPFGPALLAVSARGICGLQFVAGDARATLKEMQRGWERADWVEDSARAESLAKELFSPSGDDLSLALHLRGSNFQLQVWQALLRIPQGAVISYGDLATRLGRPGAARAIGTAVGANPVALIIPCHRVLRSSGALGGYRWGEERKWGLLARETLARKQGVAGGV